MNQIRRQSLVSSVMVYGGFALGFFNTYLFTREGGFTQEQYGLTGVFIAIASLMYSFANLGMPAYIHKFFPYYKKYVAVKNNDQLSWALLITMIGFVLVALSGLLFKETVFRKFGNSPELIHYYYWVFPFGLGLTLYSILENYAWQVKESVLTNYLREVQFRLFTTLLILFSFAGIIGSFDWFVKLYSFTYLAIALILLVVLYRKGFIHFTLRKSIVTIKFGKKIRRLIVFVFGGALVFSIATVFDSLLIASVLKDGLVAVAIYSLAQNIASLIQAPQRGIISSTMGALSEAWRDKDMPRLQRLYAQSSINQLIFSVGMFALIWLNFTDGVDTFHLQQNYKDAQWVFLFIGLMRIIDMGTGVSSQIIATSSRWHFEFYTGIILLLITLPLNYFLTKYYFGVKGPAIANLVSFTIYNAIRFWFLKSKFNLQPFNWKSLLTIFLGLGCFQISYWLFHHQSGFIWITLRSTVFILLYGAGTVGFKLSGDIIPIWHQLLKRMGIKKGAPIDAPHS